MPGKLRFATEATYHQGARAARTSRSAEYQREALSFLLGAEEYAIDLLRIREIIKPRPITEVPRAPAFVLGIVSVRGAVIPIVDLRRRMRLPAAPPTRDARVLIVNARGDEPVGLTVDAVRHVVRMRDEDVEPPPAMFGGPDAEFIAGIGRPWGERMLILLQLDAVLNWGKRP